MRPRSRSQPAPAPNASGGSGFMLRLAGVAALSSAVLWSGLPDHRDSDPGSPSVSAPAASASAADPGFSREANVVITGKAATAGASATAAIIEAYGVFETGKKPVDIVNEVSFTDSDGDSSTLRITAGRLDWEVNGKKRGAGLRAIAFSSPQGQGSGSIVAPAFEFAAAPSEAVVGAGKNLVADLKTSVEETVDLLVKMYQLCWQASPRVEVIIDGVSFPSSRLSERPSSRSAATKRSSRDPAAAEPASDSAPTRSSKRLTPAPAPVDHGLWPIRLGSGVDKKCGAGPGYWCTAKDAASPECGSSTCASKCGTDLYCENAPTSVKAKPFNGVIPSVEYWNGLVRMNSEMMRVSGKDAKLLFFGDSMTEDLNGTRGGAPTTWSAACRKHLGRVFQGVPVVTSGLGGDQTQHMLWRLLHANELGDATPDAVVLLAGTNNLGLGHQDPRTAALGVAAVAQAITHLFPDAKVFVIGIPPRTDCLQWQTVLVKHVQGKKMKTKGVQVEKGCTFGDKAGSAKIPKIKEANKILQSTLSSEKDLFSQVTFVDCWSVLLGDAPDQLPPDYYQDFLHLSARGYHALWGECLLPALRSGVPSLQLPEKIPEWKNEWA